MHLDLKPKPLMKPKKDYLFQLYRCPYCKQYFIYDDAIIDRAKCYKEYRARNSEVHRKRQKERMRLKREMKAKNDEKMD